MGHEARENMMAVLPNRFDHHQRSLGRNLAKDFDAVALTVNESVLLHWIKWVSAANGMSASANRTHHRLFHLVLGRPAGSIR
jgi:hypothetical protein